MPGTRSAAVRILTMGVALALAALLLAAREATAGEYKVAQCGWRVDRDASWADTTGGSKFRPDAWCLPPHHQNPFDGVHLKSFTRSGSPTISGTRFARWRWEAPDGTGITWLSGTWWHALHDGMEQRIGVGTWNGGFQPFLIADSTDTSLDNFSKGFSTPQPALEDRLLCARGESRWCNLDKVSWSGLRGLKMALDDGHAPVPGKAGAELASGGWRRGSQRVNYWDTDRGGGVQFSETLIDGARVGLTEYPCGKAFIDGEWMGTRMQPCPTGAADEVTVSTESFSDGRHELTRCAIDFAGNRACRFPVGVRIDNNPPAHVRKLVLAGGEGWRRANDFDFSWVNPDQGPGSPIGGAHWRITGPGSYDTGIKLTRRRDIEAIANRTVPAPGVYRFHVWLRDEAGNSAPSSSAVDATMRYDGVRPAVAFDPPADTAGPELPAAVRAEVTDAHSGPASGEILYRRADTNRWTELPAKLQAIGTGRTAALVARLPGDLPAGTYVFRADVTDRAGNRASSGRRADGPEMSLRKTRPPRRTSPSSPRASRRRASPRSGAGHVRRAARPKAKTRLFARLRRGRRRGRVVTAPFGRGAVLTGRLVTARGAGLAGRRLRVVSRFSRGAFRRKRVESIRTGKRGGFRLALRAGPSRRVTVRFHGATGLTGSRRAGMSLRVRGGLHFRARPRRLRTGDVVRLWGRVRSRGTPLPRRGKLIAIQYFEREARRWRPVLLTRSDHRGRFRSRYRFRYVSGVARIGLRAVALPEERWPYVAGASRPVTVRVSG